MKVGILIDRFNVGGVEKIAVEQVAALRKNGVDAELLVLTSTAVVPNAFMDLRKNIPIVYLGDRLPSILRGSFKFPIFHFFSLFHLSYPLFLPFVVPRNEYSYIICHGTFTCFSAISLKYFSKISYSAFVWDPIGYILDKVYSTSFNPAIFSVLHALAKSLDRLIVGTADEILVGGTAHNAYFSTLSPVVKIVVIPPSVHPVKKLYTGVRSGLLLLTAWKRGKNPEFIFKILKKIPNLKVNIVGKWLDEDYKKDFESEVLQKKLSKNITVHGGVSELELSKWYSHSEVFLQINDDRGFGMPALEAAAHGTPFIIPKGQGVCALFKNKLHGYYITEKNVKEIVHCLERLTTEKNLASTMGKAGFDMVKENYSWEKHAVDLLNVVKRNT